MAHKITKENLRENLEKESICNFFQNIDSTTLLQVN